MLVVAIKPHPYFGINKKIDEQYEINSQSDFRLFSTLGLVRAVDEPKQVMVVKPMRSLGRPRKIQTEPERPKRKYNRRDMTAKQ